MSNFGHMITIGKYDIYPILINDFWFISYSIEIMNGCMVKIKI